MLAFNAEKKLCKTITILNGIEIRYTNFIFVFSKSQSFFFIVFHSRWKHQLICLFVRQIDELAMLFGRVVCSERASSITRVFRCKWDINANITAKIEVSHIQLGKEQQRTSIRYFESTIFVFYFYCWCLIALDPMHTIEYITFNSCCAQHGRSLANPSLFLSRTRHFNMKR